MLFSKKLSYILVAVVIIVMMIAPSCSNQRSDQSKNVEEYFSEIDAEIIKTKDYEEEKQNVIRNLKIKLTGETNPEFRKELIDWIIDEYEAFISDSALYYVNQNLESEIVKNDKRQETALLIKKADIAAHAGLFGEASDILKSISRSQLSDSLLLENYYSAYCDLYQYQSEYAINTEYANHHEMMRELYIDSVGQVASPTSINYIINHAAHEARNGNIEEAENLLLNSLAKYNRGERNYSILCSILADIYKRNADKSNYLKYISESVISDLRGAIKENMAIRALATECFENGDLERAERYLRQSFADANFYAARMRNAQSSSILPIVGEAYTTNQKEMNHKLSLLVIFLSIVSGGFIIITIFSFLQVKKIRSVNQKTKKMLEDVSKLSNELADVNLELKETNKALQNSNIIKEEYAILFMEYCSMSISALQQYQIGLKSVAAQGNMNLLLKKINSESVESKMMDEFYTKFDEAILHIYPNFVENFNALLKDKDRIEIKAQDRLNTELRVFALIRIGINDSEKIAKFLQCSVTTVYTYRSKIKKKAISPDKFEESLANL